MKKFDFEEHRADVPRTPLRNEKDEQENLQKSRPTEGVRITRKEGRTTEKPYREFDSFEEYQAYKNSKQYINKEKSSSSNDLFNKGNFAQAENSEEIADNELHTREKDVSSTSPVIKAFMKNASHPTMQAGLKAPQETPKDSTPSPRTKNAISELENIGNNPNYFTESKCEIIRGINKETKLFERSKKVRDANIQEVSVKTNSAHETGSEYSDDDTTEEEEFDPIAFNELRKEVSKVRILVDRKSADFNSQVDDKQLDRIKEQVEPLILDKSYQNPINHSSNFVEETKNTLPNEQKQTSHKLVSNEVLNSDEEKSDDGDEDDFEVTYEDNELNSSGVSNAEEQNNGQVVSLRDSTCDLDYFVSEVNIRPTEDNNSSAKLNPLEPLGGIEYHTDESDAF